MAEETKKIRLKEDVIIDESTVYAGGEVELSASRAEGYVNTGRAEYVTEEAAAAPQTEESGDNASQSKGRGQKAK